MGYPQKPTEKAMNTPDPSLPPLVPEGPRRDMLIRISVSANFEKRLDNQWEVEREIQADRWQWEWAGRQKAESLKACEDAFSKGWDFGADEVTWEKALAVYRGPTQVKPTQFFLDEKLEELKSGQWWVWSCTAEMSDGTERRGTVQSDGHMFAEQTWQEEDV